MGMFETAEQWLWTVALKKIIAASVGFLASKEAMIGLAWLEAHGVHIAIDPQKFQTVFMVSGVAGFALAHDWLKLKFPDSKYL